MVFSGHIAFKEQTWLYTDSRDPGIRNAYEEPIELSAIAGFGFDFGLNSYNQGRCEAAIRNGVSVAVHQSVGSNEGSQGVSSWLSEPSAADGHHLLCDVIYSLQLSIQVMKDSK